VTLAPLLAVTLAPLPTGSTTQLNCQIGLGSWRTGWTPAKRDWCCHHAQLGCLDVATHLAPVSASTPQATPVTKPVTTRPVTTLVTTGDPYDCGAGFKNWVAGWSETKKTWCCAHKRMGCTITTTFQTTTTYNCNSDYTPAYSILLSRWTPGKRTWCCEHKRRGCTPPPTTNLIPTTTVATTTATFDCMAAFFNWKRQWGPDKKAWCCKHEKRGCEGS